MVTEKIGNLLLGDKLVVAGRPATVDLFVANFCRVRFDDNGQTVWFDLGEEVTVLLRQQTAQP